MKLVKFLTGGRPNRKGFLLILVVITIALGFLLLAASMTSLNPFAPFQGTGADRYSDPNAAPWDESHLFIKKALDGYDMGGRRPPFRVQPKFEDTAYYYGSLVCFGETRGNVMVRISPDGDVQAEWSGKLKLRGVEYEVVYEKIEASDYTSIFKGNIAPLKVYEDENGKDHRKLYFITAGQALAVSQSGAQFQSYGYVTGWINKDRTCFGKLWLPQGLDGAETVYEWEAVPPGEKH